MTILSKHNQGEYSHGSEIQRISELSILDIDESWHTVIILPPIEIDSVVINVIEAATWGIQFLYIDRRQRLVSFYTDDVVEPEEDK